MNKTQQPNSQAYTFLGFKVNRRFTRKPRTVNIPTPKRRTP